MSTLARLRAQAQVLEARRRAHLENAAYYRARADTARQLRNEPPPGLQPYEHQRAMDRDAERLTGEARRADREADLALEDLRRIEHTLARRTRQER